MILFIYCFPVRFAEFIEGSPHLTEGEMMELEDGELMSSDSELEEGERMPMKVKKKVLVKKPKAEKSLDQKNTNILGKFFFILTAVSSWMVVHPFFEAK